MDKFVIKNVIILSCFMLFFGCKPKPKIENVSSNEKTIEVSQPIKEVFDTLAFIESIHRWPYESGRYTLALSDSLMDNDLEYISPRELRLVRNEIFARYGYRFKDAALQAYFNKQDWYKPLFDDVEQYLTPLERANIRFIQEKEKTNTDISDEEQFHFFLEIYNKWHSRKQYPSMLNCKFSFRNTVPYATGLFHYNDKLSLPPTERYVYLIYSAFGGCNECTNYHFIHQFNKKGELLNKFYLGESDESNPYMDKKSDNDYEIWFTLYTGPRYAEDEEVPDEMWEKAITMRDTTKIQFYYDKNEQIILTKKNN